MGDGRTELYKSMWTRTTTNDKVLEKGMVDTTPLSKKTADQYPIGATLEEQAKYADWPEKDARRKALTNLHDLEHMPDQYKHKVVSFLKSAVRILGFGICWWSLDIGLTLLILAEVIGVGEELV